MSFESIERPRVKPGFTEDYLEYVNNLSEYDDPNLFGLNDNAQKT